MDQDFQSLFTPPGIQIPQSLDSYTPNSQYNVNPFNGGRLPFGIGSILMSIFGRQMWPLMNPNGQQSLYDAAWQRDHDIQMMQLARKTVSTWYPFQNMGGMNENSPVTQIVSSLMSDPDGIASKIMSPILGGNPIAAQMSSFASLQGIGSSALGTGRGVSTGELTRALEAFNSIYYKQDTRPINQEQAAIDAKPIEDLANNPESLKLLGLNSGDIAPMMDQYHQVNANTKAYDRITKLSKAISDIENRLNNPITDKEMTVDDALTGLDKNDLGSGLDQLSDQLRNTFKNSKDSYIKEFTNTLNQDETIKNLNPNLNQQLIDFEKNGNVSKNSLDQLLGNYNKEGGGKLTPEEKSQYTDAFYNALNKATPMLATAFANAAKVKPIQDAAAGINSIGQSMLLQNIMRGMDFSHNLGLNYNTLTTARNEMIRDRLISPTKDVQGLNQISELFAGSQGARVPSLITAAKGVFGNDMNDKELMQHISDYIGNSAFNAANPDDTTRLENSLRLFKSTARESNIDLNTMLSFQTQAQSFASQNPNLQNIGGLEIADMITKKTQQIAAIDTDNSPDNNWIIRAQGGTAGQLRNAIQNNLEAAANPTIMASAGIRTYIKENEDNPAKRAELLKKYDDWAAGKTSTPRDMYGALTFMENNFKGTNMSPNRAWQYAYNNPMAAAQAYEDNKDLFNQLPTGMEAATINYRIMARYGNEKKTYDANSAIGRTLGLKTGETRNLTPVELKDAYVNANQLHQLLLDPFLNLDASAGPGSVSALLGRSVNAGVFTQQTLENNPTLKANNQINQQAINVGAYLEKEIDMRMGNMRPGVMTRLAQSIASGDYSKEGVMKPFLRAMGVSDTGEAMTQLTGLTSQLEKLSGAQTVGDVAADVGMTKEADTLQKLSDASNKYGFRADQLQDIANITDVTKVAGFLQPSQLPKDKNGNLDTTELRRIRDLAASAVNMPRLYTQTLNPTTGEMENKFFDKSLDKEGFRSYFKEGMTSDVLKQLWKSRGIDDSFNALAGKQLEVMTQGTTDIPATPASKGLANAIKQFSSVVDAKGNIIGTDYEQGIKSLGDMEDQKTKLLGAGKYGLPDSMVKFLDAYKDQQGNFIPGELPDNITNNLKYDKGANQYIFDNQKDADAVVSNIDQLIESNPISSGLGKEYKDIAQQEKDFTSAATSGDDLPTMVHSILNRLDGLKDITKAINSLTGAVTGTGPAHP